MTYLRFCKPSQEINFMSIIFRENKARSLGYTSTTPFANQISVFCVCLLSLASSCLNWYQSLTILGLLHVVCYNLMEKNLFACCVPLTKHGGKRSWSRVWPRNG